MTAGTSITGTATLLSSGTAVFYFTGVAEHSHTVVVSGGTVTSFKASVTTTATSSDSRTVVTTGITGATPTVAFGVKPDSGASTVSVELFKTAAVSAQANGGLGLIRAQAILAGSADKGTLIQKYIITVASTSSVGVYSAGDSLCNIGTQTSAAAAATDATGANVIANRSNGYIDFNLVDAFGNALTGAVVIEGTTGTGIAYNGDYTATGTASDYNLVQVSTDSNGKIDVARPAALIDKGFSTTVTIKFNGVSVCTKSFTLWVSDKLSPKAMIFEKEEEFFSRFIHPCNKIKNQT
jgi:hypothetical protein